MNEQADTDGRVCYLESSNDINPAIYRKFGFETKRKVQLARGPKPVDMEIMVRQPLSKEALHNLHDTEHHGQTAKTA